jgi:phosphoserine phosphatase RsbU/P
LLSNMFQVPMAFVSLVDSDRQWFKAACGLEVKETPRAISFCGHAILADSTLVVSDATEDPRFCDNPLVTGKPHMRFYAGQPLSGPGGQKIGTLCIADTKPRTLKPEQLEALREMAQVVERELNLVEAVQLQSELIAVKEQAAEANRLKAEYLSKMVESQQSLVRELEQAAGYVRSLLPEPLTGPIQARWRFEPSSGLGGDCLGYNWIDPDHFAFYLLDVSGHGVGAALLSVSVLNALRSRSLPNTDFREPAHVLTRLNDLFPMDRHDGKFFTIWYGVFDRARSRLTYGSAGHPAALLLNGSASGPSKPVELGMKNFGIGMVEDADFSQESLELNPSARTYVFSDGAFEIEKPDGSIMSQSALVEWLSTSNGSPDDVWRFVQTVADSQPLRDDFTLLEVRFS